jgi:hypothetical protein
VFGGVMLAMHDSVVQAVSQAVGSVFLAPAPIAAVGFLVVLFLKEYPLRGAAGAESVDKKDTRAMSSAADE